MQKTPLMSGGGSAGEKERKTENQGERRSWLRWSIRCHLSTESSCFQIALQFLDVGRRWILDLESFLWISTEGIGGEKKHKLLYYLKMGSKTKARNNENRYMRLVRLSNEWNVCSAH